MNNPHLEYRSDVDGLRAVAVLAVIAFHASARLLPGGFVGVDIFFVISGFLITGLIARGMEADRFSFAEFYTRRIKRILPAYIAVAVVTLVVSSWLLIPNDYIFYTTSLAASWAFAANVFFSMLSWGYFGQRTEEFPLLHTWSLSVEEQFYFIFPILLLVLYRFGRRHILSLLLVLGVAFAALSQWKTGEVKSYFLLSSRAHELIIGALCYFIQQRAPLRSSAWAQVFGLGGLTMMVASFFMLNRGSTFPGINSLYPCLGAALLIHAGTVPNLATRFLKTRPMVAVGLISYSLYLWHWPIFSFLRYRHIEINFAVGAAAVAGAFALAIASWRWIEQPVRHSRSLTFPKAFFRYYAVPAALFMSVGLYSYMTEGAPRRFPEDIRQLISSYSFERDLSRSCSIRPSDYHLVSLEYLESHCAYGDMNKPKSSILLMGDSHAHHFKPTMEELASNAGLRMVYHVQGGCSPVDLAQDTVPPSSTPSTCQKRNEDLLRLAGNFKYVALGSYWSSEDPAGLEKRLQTTVDRIIKAGATPVIFKDAATHEPDLSQCILFLRRGWISQDTNCSIPVSYTRNLMSESEQIIDRVAARSPGAIVIDPKRVMCDARECPTYLGNIALYKDSNHLNAKAATVVARLYIEKLGNPFGHDGKTGNSERNSAGALREVGALR
ncbi:MAG: acyltransferase family protein [Herminiimonas sp.]|nr:acyltransferase family protein [Herminiimonas sp.]